MMGEGQHCGHAYAIVAAYFAPPAPAYPFDAAATCPSPSPLRLDLVTLQSCLGSSNLCVEFLHLIGFLLRWGIWI